jgi:flagellin-specific chaperone FliS
MGLERYLIARLKQRDTSRHQENKIKRGNKMVEDIMDMWKNILNLLASVSNGLMDVNHLTVYYFHIWHYSCPN